LLIVAHSMGALLVARAGSGDCDGPLQYISVVYLNPLIGGSHYADDIPALRWLRPLRPVVQHLFFPPSVKDLIPESDFQQAIFGRGVRLRASLPEQSCSSRSAPAKSPTS